MKIAYAFRRATLHPHHGSGLPPVEARPQFLREVRRIGFDAVELGLEVFGGDISQSTAQELRAQLEDAGLQCGVIRGGGGFTDPDIAVRSRKRLEDAIRCASWIGASVVNTTVPTHLQDPDAPGSFVGEPVSQGGSRTATEEDFERTANNLREVAELAADHAVQISIEVHQHSIIDNSRSALRLLELVDRPIIGVNPDLGNIYWTYEIPEESCEHAIVALAPHAKYWHCKNLLRVHVPDVHRAVFVQVPLPDGEIDYRFAITAMVKAGFDGYLAIEGIRFGDQFHRDAKSVAYVRNVLNELRLS